MIIIKDKIKILHLISNTCINSGPQQIVLSLIRKVDRSLFDSYVLLIDDSMFREKSVLEKELAQSICINRIQWNKKKLFLDGIWNLKKIIKREGIHLLHCHDNRAGFLGLIIGKIMNLPIIRSVHGYLEHSFKFKFFYSIDNILLKYFDRVIVGSHALQIKIGRIPSPKIAIIHNAIDLDSLNKHVTIKEVKIKFKINDATKVISTVGRLHQEKGYIYLLQAAKKVCEKFVNVKFLIVGEGPLKPQLEELAQTLKLN